ncbi:MAG TPA: sulfatase [Verrucomicrobiota bacterium]|nr:sulfatase [Verrucomicrobiota bacterium]HNU50463.1 sulfatase [Verrucomicrobiota bacterium]
MNNARHTWAAVVIAAFVSGAAMASAAQPNVVVILADDLGAHDLGCYGADLHETPHVDRLAREGVRFTQAYAPSPVCTPTRAALLTGKHPARLGITIWSEGSVRGPTDRRLLQAASWHDLPLGEVTLAERLQAAGYLTALVGKWHLGDAAHAPETQGFEVNIGGTHWGAPQTYFWPYRGTRGFGGEFRYVPHLGMGRPGEYLTDRLTDEALRVIDHAAEAKRPFFLYLAHHAPHTPLEAKPAAVARYRAKLRPGLKHQNPVYAAMVGSLDESVGRVLSRLNRRGLGRNTIVVFAGDNGGYLGTAPYEGRAIPATDNWPLRSGKGTLYEGGLRVPLLVKWPGVTSAGGVCDEPVVLTDLFRTLAVLARQAASADEPSDGLDLGPLLRNPRGRLDREALFFHYPHYYHAPPSTPASAVRRGEWKLIEWFEDNRVELYNLREDPSEERDLATRLSGKAEALRGQLQEWRAAVGARMPRPNPEFKASASP